MTRRSCAAAPVPFAGGIVDVPIAAEVSESFLAYSLSVITSRAIPDVRDGLKPVQRRILFSMLRMGLRPDTPHRKCARVVGDTMGKYHPHGDAAIYDALVRMGQDFSRGVPLVDPQGNFGTLDDPPAAARYTECRLSSAAMEMLDDLDEETVDFRASYDGEATEPVCLPGRLPNLLVNGTSGIAVGMATNMAPHNLCEVYEAVRLQMDDPDVSTEALMAVLPAPDFPSGGLIVDEGLTEAYATGRGIVRMRARADVLDVGARRQAIRFSELPWLVGPEKVVGKIKELVGAGRLDGVEDVKNLSDRHSGLCIQVDCRPGVDAAAVLAQLWRLSPIEETFAINNVVLAGGTPVTATLKDLLAHYIAHRLDVVVRRTNHRVDVAEQRLHILEGLILALDNIDMAVSIIRGSKNAGVARTALCERLNLSETQADAVLEMRLRRLAALERQKVVDEAESLVAALAGYRKLLASPENQRAAVVEELGEMVERFGRPRRTRIVSADCAEITPAESPTAANNANGAGDYVVTLSSSHIVGRSPVDAARRRTLRRHDLVAATAPAGVDTVVWAITNTGRAVSALAEAIPEVAGRSRGVDARDAFELERNERARGLLTAAAYTGEPPSIVIATRHGNIKRLAHNELFDTAALNIGPKRVISLSDADEVIAAFTCPPGGDIALISTDGSLLRTASENLPVRRLSGVATAGMRLRPGARLATAAAVFADAYVFIATNAGAAKATPIADFSPSGRGGMGVRICNLRDGDKLRDAHVGPLVDVYALTGTRPSSPDSEPVPFPLPPTRRGLVARFGPQPILAVGQRRW